MCEMVVKPNKFQYIVINRLGKLEDSCKLKVDNSSVIKRKGESQSGCFKDDTAQQIFSKTKFSYPLICTRIREWGIFFSRKIWHALLFWSTHFQIFPFVLLPASGSKISVTLLGIKIDNKLNFQKCYSTIPERKCLSTKCTIMDI